MSAAPLPAAPEERFCGLVGTHPRMLELREAIRRAAALDAPVVLCGPTGSGKELVARALHALGGCRERRFCPVNVAALPEALVESELFGSARGAFTGATADRPGIVDAAEGGTLFLDEAGDLSRCVQAKLLRAVEYGEVRRVGRTDVRVRRFRLVTAVQEEPAALMRSGTWREDFYFRVAGLVVRVPSLAEHRSDIPLLVRAYLAARGLPPASAEALTLLGEHAWPGNVRELEQTLVRAAFHCGDGEITAAAVRAALADGEGGQAEHAPVSLDAARCRHVRETVERCGGDTRQAAEVLGVSRSQVYRLLNARNDAGPSAHSHPCECHWHGCESRAASEEGMPA